MPKNLDDEFEEFNTSDQNLLDALMQVEASEVPRTQVSVDLNMLQDEFDDEDFLLDEAILKEADIIASQVLQDQSLPRPTSPKFHRTQLFASQHLPLFEKENVPTPNIVLNQLQQEKASLQQDILTKSGELSILRQNMKRLNTENAELKTRLLQQTSLTTQQHRSVTEELKSKVQELESRLRFKEQEMISLRMSRKRSSLSRSVSEPKPELTMTVGVGTEPLKPSKTSDVFLFVQKLSRSQDLFQGMDQRTIEYLSRHQMEKILVLFSSEWTEDKSDLFVSRILEMAHGPLQGPSINMYMIKMIRLFISSVHKASEAVLKHGYMLLWLESMVSKDESELKSQDRTQMVHLLHELATTNTEPVALAKIVCQCLPDWFKKTEKECVLGLIQMRNLFYLPKTL